MFDDSKAISVGLDVDLADAQDASALLGVVDQLCYRASKAHLRRVEITEKDLTPEERRAFASAKRLEFAPWIDNKVIELATAQGIPRERVARCRWVLIYKRLEDQASVDPLSPHLQDKSGRVAKARLVILGYQDPDLGEKRTWSPTLRRDSRNLIVAIIAHQG